MMPDHDWSDERWNFLSRSWNRSCGACLVRKERYEDGRVAYFHGSEKQPKRPPCPGHTTHHDDCGCKSGRLEARIAVLEAALREVRRQARNGHYGPNRAFDSIQKLATAVLRKKVAS
jgi:hypothetical protein